MSSAVDRTVVRMKDFRPQLFDGMQALTSRAVGVAKRSDGFVRANPWAAVGAVAAAGLVAGLMASAAQVLAQRRRASADTAAAAAAN